MLPGRHTAAGFTLLEVLVVVAVIAIVVAMVGLNVGGDAARRVKDEAQRLALLVQTAQEEAVLQGAVVILMASEDHYEFLKPGKDGKPEPLQGDEVLRRRQLHDSIVIDESEVSGIPAGRSPALVFLPTGEFEPFRIVVRGRDSAWTVSGDEDGSVLAEPLEEQAL